jgi:hypothetical protein
LVEQIVEKRVCRRKTWYMVKWEEYSEEDNSWEPAEALAETMSLTDWEEKKGRGEV